MGPPGVLGIWGFGDLAISFQGAGGGGGTVNYFMGYREQAHSFWDLGSPAKK